MVFYNLYYFIEVNVVAAQKQAQLLTKFLFFTRLHCPQFFFYPPALPLFRCPWLRVC